MAGASECSPEDNKKMQKLFRRNNKLHSYFHAKEEGKGLEGKWFCMNLKNKVNLFLDSGAFSALTQGIEINIYQYIDFIKKHLDVLEVYANLDFIPKKEQPSKNGAENTRKPAEEQLSQRRSLLGPGILEY